MTDRASSPDLLQVFTDNESAVRSYARAYPVLFERAEGASMFTADGRRYLDFLAGAGSLNYGHNHPAMRAALMDYIGSGGITHSLDMHTSAKGRFLDAFAGLILEPRGLEYRIQFPGPTGANGVEAALKLARKITGRQTVVAFTNGFHGVTLGALATTGNGHHRGAAGITLGGVFRMPYAGYAKGLDSLAYLEQCLQDASSGLDHPAAVIVESVQGEGGLNAASFAWLRGLEQLCRRHDIVLILDDIQAGCGRTGTFFSFEPAGIRPDIVVLSKSLSGFGLPLAVVLIRPDLDAWKPGEHNGTFRGNNHAFVTATAALETFWQSDDFAQSVRAKADTVRAEFDALVQRHGPDRLLRKGRGLMTGIRMPDGGSAEAVKKACFEAGLVIETAGPDDEVLKCFCPLTIDSSELAEGLSILGEAIGKVLLDDERLEAIETAGARA